jgi:cytoskeletal protein CcmA (bactofilin family)
VKADQHKNIKIFGEGTSPGGSYYKVRIKGQGNIKGDIDCHTINIFGDSRFNGTVKVKEFKLFGSTTVHDEFMGGKNKIFGSLDIRKKMTGGICEVRGWLSSADAIEMDEMCVKGGLNLEGLLNVGELRMRLGNATSRVKEIGGEFISVKGKRFNLFGGQQELVAETIEGDTIHLDYTTAKIVRGKHVTLGPGCNIDLVEYETGYKRHKTSQVKEAKRV